MPNEASPGDFSLGPSSPFSSAPSVSDSPPAPTTNTRLQNDTNPPAQPQTPTRPRPRPHPRPHRQQHSRSPSLPSPMAMSLHHLGIGTPSPLLRQFSTFSSPPAWGSPPLLGIGFPTKNDHSHNEDDTRDPFLAHDSEPELELDDDPTQDSKDVLVQRLSDLVQRLRGAKSVCALDELHAKVDEMEEVLSGGRGMGPGQGVGDEVSSAMLLLTPPLVERREADWKSGEVLSPPLLAVESGGEVDGGLLSGKSHSQDITMEVVVEAEKVNAELVKLAERLKARKEESDHIQAMLVERAEAAAAHILELETEVAELEDEIGGNESDLRHLRIELRAIEILCREFVPPEADPDLVRSVENWKTDWARLKERISANKRSRRLRHGGDVDGDSTILTPSISSTSVLESPG